jgi:DNA helicase-2/ATP-dependent DNA helicase PcrA
MVRKTKSVDILESLNPTQQEAVEHVGGPLLILAGAGSGKTRVITHRAAYLIKAKRVKPENILAVTFTNKAAKEMRDRLVELVGDAASVIWIGTFHGTCTRILRRHSPEIGLGKGFTIYDSPDQLEIVKECMGELNISEERFNPHSIRSRISRAKNSLIWPEEYVPERHNIFDKKVAEVYRLYQEKLTKASAFDFDDLIMYAVRLFRGREEVLSRYRDQFRYVMVDEYQDTNHAQYVLVDLLAGGHRNLCVVGDDSQNIYSWRGADIRNILEFEKDYPDAKVIKLEQNYRSTGNILEGANNLIRHNRRRKDKNLWTENPIGDPIFFYQGFDKAEEGEYISREILKACGRKLRFRDFAILYRINAQSRSLEESFRRAAVPYRIVSGVEFYGRREIKDLLAYLRVIVNRADSLSLKRIINVPRRSIGKASLEKILSHSQAQDIGLLEALERADEIDGLSAANRRAIKGFTKLLDKYISLKDKLPPSQILRGLIEDTGYLDELAKGETEEATERVANVEELMSAVVEYEDRTVEANLERFLEEVALVADIDNWDGREDAVAMMTLHSAKGLEFPAVFISGIEEGLLPIANAFDDDMELEEERRLFYVGMTRAKERLYLTCSAQRKTYSGTVWSQPSRFVGEIPEHLLEGIK